MGQLSLLVHVRLSKGSAGTFSVAEHPENPEKKWHTQRSMFRLLPCAKMLFCFCF